MQYDANCDGSIPCAEAEGLFGFDVEGWDEDIVAERVKVAAEKALFCRGHHLTEPAAREQVQTLAATYTAAAGSQACGNRPATDPASHAPCSSNVDASAVSEPEPALEPPSTGAG